MNSRILFTHCSFPNKLPTTVKPSFHLDDPDNTLTLDQSFASQGQCEAKILKD